MSRDRPHRACSFHRLVRFVAMSLAVGAAAAAAPVAAQVTAADWDPTQTRATRAALEALLVRYEAAASSAAYSDSLRVEAEDHAALIRDRLASGDFRPGDRVSLLVEGHQPLSDTFDVTAGQTIILPGVGTVALAGVLRSELQDRVVEAVSRTIRDPQVRSQSMVRVAVDGSVSAPGHYLVDSDDPLSEVLMRGGALSRDARRGAARVERGSTVIVDADAFQDALRRGLTIDHLGIREGDRIFVPEAPSAFFDTIRQYILVIPALLGLITLLS